MNFIKQLLGWKSKQNNEDPIDNKIVFCLNPEKNNEPFIKIIISDTSKESCYKFGEMLFAINSGLYHTSIAQLLMNMGKEDKEIKNFVETSIMHWADLIKDSEDKNIKNSKWKNKDKPLIMPMDFNKNAR